VTVSVDTALFEVMLEEATDESPLWGALARSAESREAVQVFSLLVKDPRLALGVETVYEGYLLHYGRSRLFDTPDADDALLLGDYLYAHGLVRVSAAGNAAAVYDLAELISLCAQARAAETDGDGYAWAATAARLGEGALVSERADLRTRRESGPLARAALAAVGGEALERALAAHEALAGGRSVR
jgi:hypothetical protein